MTEILGKSDSSFKKIADGLGVAASTTIVDLVVNKFTSPGSWINIGSKLGVGLVGSTIPKVGNYVSAGGITAGSLDIMKMVIGNTVGSSESSSGEYLPTIVI